MTVGMPGSFAEALRATGGRRPSRIIDDILEGMEPGDAQELLAALADASVPAPSIARALNALGYSISGRSVQSYRAEVMH